MPIFSLAALAFGLDSKSKAEEEMKRQQEAQDKLFADLEKQRADQEAKLKEEQQSKADELKAEGETVLGKNAKSRQKALAKGAQGRSSTILTSPLGEVGTADTGKKTLLGE